MFTNLINEYRAIVAAGEDAIDACDEIVHYFVGLLQRVGRTSVNKKSDTTTEITSHGKHVMTITGRLDETTNRSMVRFCLERELYGMLYFMTMLDDAHSGKFSATNGRESETFRFTRGVLGALEKSRFF